MRLHISHDTHYRYLQAVHTAHHLAHLSPPNTPAQTVCTHELSIWPQTDADALSHRIDGFGNHVCQWQIASAHDELLVRASTLVDTHPPEAPRVPDCCWSQAAEHYRYISAQHSDAATRFGFASTHVPRSAIFADYAAPSFAPGASLVEAALDLLARMDADFDYRPLSTDIHTPAQQALEQRAGVCQDFAHIMLACLRSLGLSARYVSGYLLTHAPAGQARLRGADASHAWLALHVPSATGPGHWLHLDPTNHRSGWDSPGPDYVVLATGMDFADVSPLRGVLQGGASHELQVAVTVEPAASS